MNTLLTLTVCQESVYNSGMNTEIEIKAHVGDSEALRILLSGKAEYSHAFEKEDAYWFDGETSGLQALKLRVRKEKRRPPDGVEESRCLATYKSKEVNDGFEVNDELEFEVNPVEEFEQFLHKAGLKPGANKRKRGWAFSKAEITAELVEVEGLGWFIEVEILTDKAGGGNVAEEKEKLLAFLDSLGIERQAVEKRFYLDMLYPA